MGDTVLIDGATITVLPDGVRTMVVHSRNDCTGRECVVHKPTNHAMRSWPLTWRPERGMFERCCPHGIGHPDPDQEAWWRQQASWIVALDDEAVDPAGDIEALVQAEMTHGCDGCCS